MKPQPQLWIPGRDTPLKSELAAARDPVKKALVETGLFETGHGFTYRCLICGKTERNDQRMELVCSGPSWTDEHPHEPMVLVSG